MIRALIVIIILIPQLHPPPEITLSDSGSEYMDISMTPDELRILAGEIGYVSLDFNNKINNAINVTMLVSLTACCGSPDTNVSGINYYVIQPYENLRFIIEIKAFGSLPVDDDVDDINIFITWRANSTVNGTSEIHIEILTDFIYVILPIIISLSVFIPIFTIFSIFFIALRKKSRKNNIT